jgi:hypothetical protein
VTFQPWRTYDPVVDLLVGEGQVGGQFVDDVVAELGVDDDAGDVAEPVVEDAAGEVVGAVFAVALGVAGRGVAHMVVEGAGSFGVGDGDVGSVVGALGADVGAFASVDAGAWWRWPWCGRLGVFVEPVLAPGRQETGQPCARRRTQRRSWEA